MPLLTDQEACIRITECGEATALRWKRQEQENEAASALHRRWGSRLDAIDAAISDLKVKFAISSDHTTELRVAMETMSQQNRETWTGVSNVLKELTESINDTRRAAEANHSSLLEVVTSNASTAGRAVDQAHIAAKQADEAQQAAEKSSTKLSTMTKIVFTAWAITVAAISTVGAVLLVHYGWPVMYRVIDRAFGLGAP